MQSVLKLRCSPLSACRGGCGSVPPSARSLLLWQMHFFFFFFYLAGNLEMAFLFCVVGFSLLSLASSWHTGMPKAIIEKKKKTQLSLSDGSSNVARTDGCGASAARSFGDWQRSSSSLAHSSPSLNRCSKDEGAATDGLLPIMSYTVWDIGVNYSRGTHEGAKPRRCSA